MRAALLLVTLTVALARLPLIGALLPHEPGPSPSTRWPLIALGAAVLIAALWPWVRRFLSTPRPAGPAASRPFPRFGWAALVLTAAAWAVAWGAVPGLERARPYTFAPLWLGYLGAVLAWTKRRSGRSLLDEPRRLLGLTAISSVFWWFFEYLNEFVGSWSYSGVALGGPVDLLFFAVLPFATVLPAVAATRELLATAPRLDAAFATFVPLAPRQPRLLGALLAAAGFIGLAALSLLPNLLFPLVWLAPLLVLTGAQAALRMPHVFSALPRGDHRGVVTWALAALVCGFFWEGWNWLSVARWSYVIPYLGEPKLFEMPLLGYAGYLTFGWECAAVAALVQGSDPPTGIPSGPGPSATRGALSPPNANSAPAIPGRSADRSHGLNGGAL